METTYKVKPFNLSGLSGISDETLEMHFKLYEGYVKQTNPLTERISEIIKDGHIDQEEMPAYSELTRRLGFEYNGMVLHEYYFENMTRGGAGTLNVVQHFSKRPSKAMAATTSGRRILSASARCVALAGQFAIKIPRTVDCRTTGSGYIRSGMSRVSIQCS